MIERAYPCLLLNLLLLNDHTVFPCDIIKTAQVIPRKPRGGQDLPNHLQKHAFAVIFCLKQ